MFLTNRSFVFSSFHTITNVYVLQRNISVKLTFVQRTCEKFAHHTSDCRCDLCAPKNFGSRKLLQTPPQPLTNTLNERFARSLAAESAHVSPVTLTTSMIRFRLEDGRNHRVEVWKFELWLLGHHWSRVRQFPL